MIYPSLNLIADQLNTNMFEKWGATINGTNEIVQLNNIANINDEKYDLYNKIIITLLKIEEETSLKNSAFYNKILPNQIQKHQPPVYLNLYMLVAITKKNYREALQLLSDTVTFFQYNKAFTGTVPGATAEENDSYRITVELHDINFQEVFDMWSNLGSKQFPSIIYKVRLLKFFDSNQTQEVPAVKTINVHYDLKDH